MLHLYEHPLSPYAQKIKIALYEKGIPFEAVTPDLWGQADEAFKKASVRREVPTLLDGELALTDSTIILEYLEDKWPDPPLYPKGPAARARARLIEDVCDTYVEAINWGIFEVRLFGRAEGELAERLLARAKEQLGGVFSYFERQLGDALFFGGESFGLADLSVLPHVAAAVGQGMRPPEGSKLNAWFGRVTTRESVQKTLAAAQAVMGSMPDLKSLVAAGAIVRQYRDHRIEWMLRSGGAAIVEEGMAKKTIKFSIEIA